MPLIDSIACWRARGENSGESGGSAAGLHALKVEDVVDEADEAVVLVTAIRRSSGLRIYVPDNSGGEQAEGAADAGERGAELVGDGGDELILEIVELGALVSWILFWYCSSRRR